MTRIIMPVQSHGVKTSRPLECSRPHREFTANRLSVSVKEPRPQGMTQSSPGGNNHVRSAPSKGFRGLNNRKSRKFSGLHHPPVSSPFAKMKVKHFLISVLLMQSISPAAAVNDAMLAIATDVCTRFNTTAVSGMAPQDLSDITNAAAMDLTNAFTGDNSIPSTLDATSTTVVAIGELYFAVTCHAAYSLKHLLKGNPDAQQLYNTLCPDPKKIAACTDMCTNKLKDVISYWRRGISANVRWMLPRLDTFYTAFNPMLERFGRTFNDHAARPSQRCATHF